MQTAFPVNPPVNRLQGALPKVGIRPVIDGRRQGVRESMEAATMAMARAAADLITAARAPRLRAARRVRNRRYLHRRNRRSRCVRSEIRA
jgi:L-fucose isomerase-like protein